MKSKIVYLGVLIFISSQVIPVFGQETNSVIWRLNSLTSIEGHEVQVIDDPIKEAFEWGYAISFDGDRDQIIINHSPLKDYKKFTIEMIFKPHDAYPDNQDPRIFHIQDPANNNRRVILECRLTDDQHWYFDGYISADDDEKLALMDETLLHPVNEWHHVAITYYAEEFKTYVNGQHELTGYVLYEPIDPTNGKSSVGARMNQAKHFKGLVAMVRITNEVLTPDQFFTKEQLFSEEIVLLGSDKFVGNDQITIHPNPVVNDVLTISKVKGFDDVNIEILDLSGTKIKEKEVVDPGRSFELKLDESISPGTYLLRIFTSNEVYTAKFIK